jgi:hypothetical protein
MVSVPYPDAPATCNGLGPGESGQGFRAAADPASPFNPRYFGTNANNVIYESTATLFDDMPEIGDPASGHPLR